MKYRFKNRAKGGKKFKGSKVQRFKSSKVQKFKSSKVLTSQSSDDRQSRAKVQMSRYTDISTIMTKWQIVQMLLAEWRLAETLKSPVFTGVPEDSAFRHSANRHSEDRMDSSPETGHESPVDFYGCGLLRGLGPLAVEEWTSLDVSIYRYIDISNYKIPQPWLCQLLR